MAGLYTGSKRTTGKLEQASVVAKKKSWSDLDLSLKIHPIRKDIISLKDDAAIKNAVKNLLVSNFYERPFQDDLGANLRGLLFEPTGLFTEIMLRDSIKDVLDNHEPRIRVTSINIIDNARANSYGIIVNFIIKEFDTSTSVNIELRRLR
jgi:phage baseplate assembly protein W